MRTHYDFSKAKRNPYARRLKRQITIRLDEPTIAYFKSLAMDLDMPYQALINLYLRDCALNHKKLELNWASCGGRTSKSSLSPGSPAQADLRRSPEK